MTRPSTSQADKLVAYLQSRDWHSVNRQLGEAVKRNRIPSKRDGFPSGGGGSVSGGDKPDPTGNIATARDRRDPLHEHVSAAVEHLEAAVVAVQNLEHRLEAVKEISSDKYLDAPAICWAMRRVGSVEPVHRTGDVGGRLPHPKPLGRWAYDFVMSEGRLPTPEECRARAEGRRVRLKAS